MTDRKVKTEEELKKQLEETMKRIRPKVENSSKNAESVLGRFESLATRADETQTEKKKEKEKPLGLNGLAKKGNALDKKAKEAGIDNIARPTKEKDDKTKEQEKKKEKDKENSPEKQEAKMKEMFSKIKLPSGMEIHQEGPQWVLVSKDGKQRTDVTDVMNTIDKFNRNVDVANNQNAVQGGVDKAADVNKKDNGLLVNETSGKVQIIGEVLPKVKDVNGEPVFKPEDVKAVAEAAVSYSDEKALLAKLKDPRALEEMQKRNKNNENVAEEMARKRAIELQSR